MKRSIRLSAVLAIAVFTSALRTSPIHAAAPPPGTVPGPAPVAALQANGDPSDGRYAVGAAANTAAQPAPRVAPDLSFAEPASVDLSQFDPPVGNQGNVNSCTAWAVTNLLGWYARRDGFYPGNAAGASGFAPMYTYAQVVHGSNSPTTFPSNLNIMYQQGVDTKADYFQGSYDYTDQPTSGERVNAVQFRISGYNDLGNPGFLGGGLQPTIESDMAAGTPVAISFPVYSNFLSLNSSNYYYSGPSGNLLGGHAVLAVKYDSSGVWIENQYGTGWGLNGYAELSWNFINFYGNEVVTIEPAPMKLRAQEVPGDYRYIYVLGSNGNLWRESGSTSNRSQVDGNVAAFQPITYPTVYVLSNDGTLWRENGNYTNRSAVDAQVHQFQALDATTVYVLGYDGKLWRETGDWTNRTLVDSNVSEFQALSSTLVFVKGTDGKLWRENGTSSNRSLVDGSVESFQAMNSTVVYVLGLNGNLWNEFGSAASRTLVDANVEAFQGLDDTQVYVEGTDGKLWSENGNSSNRNLVDGKVAEFQALDVITSLVLGTDGNLWLEEPNSSNRHWVDGNV